MNQLITTTMMLAATVILVSACNGGSGGGTTPPPSGPGVIPATPTPVPTPVIPGVPATPTPKPSPTPNPYEVKAKKADDVLAMLNAGGSADWAKIKVFSEFGNGYSVFYNHKERKFYALNVSAHTEGMTYADFKNATEVYDNLAKSDRTVQKYEYLGSKDIIGDVCPLYKYCQSIVKKKGETIEMKDQFTGEIKKVTVTTEETFYQYSESIYDWVTRTETIYTDNVSGIVFEAGSHANKDLESVSAALEVVESEAIRDIVMANYGLSEDRAQEIASLAQSWQMLSRSRAMTEKDLIEFQSNVFGADLGTVKKAYIKSAEGDPKALNKLVKQAAQLNGVSPEQAKKLLGSFVQ